MIQRFCRWVLYRCMGFRFEETVERPEKYIIALAPHTSNWDFIIGVLFMNAEGFKCGFMMKEFWFFWPLGPIFKRMGGIPVRKQKNLSVSTRDKKADKRELRHRGAVGMSDEMRQHVSLQVVDLD